MSEDNFKLIRQLLEQPVSHDGEMDKPSEMSTTYSLASIRDEFTELGVINNVHLFQSKNNRLILGFLNGVDNSQNNTTVFRLSFKEKSILTGAAQVSSVYLSTTLRQSNLAIQVYQMLVSKGWVIVSDQVHFQPAKALWKRLAQTVGKQVVYVCDVDELTSGKLGRLYDGKNIPDDEIWSIDDSSNKYYLVLILKSAVSKY